MYTPKQFKFEDKKEMIAFMKQYSFATLVTMKDDLPIASQLPFFIDDHSDTLLLCSHFALANEHANYIEKNPSLIIFAEPHAYISPTHYDKIESVPTWDYITVHVYAKGKIIVNENSRIKAMEQMITFYEKDYLQQWNNLPEKYRNGMMRGIAVFELEVTGMHGQRRLSQNKTKEERERIIQHLESSSNCPGKDLASYIKKL